MELFYGTAMPVSAGNTAGNINNGGIAVSDGQWEYYRNYTYGESGLYRMKSDGTVKERITNDAPQYLNLLDGWLYYNNIGDDETIYKIRTDGSGRTKLNSRPSGYLTVSGGWMYFIERNAGPDAAAGLDTEARTGRIGDNMIRMRLDGTERTMLTEDFSSSLSVDGGWVYYANSSDGNKLYRVRVDGSDRQKLSDDIVSEVCAKNGMVYYKPVTTGYLYGMRPDGTEKKVLSRDNVYFINPCGDWIYYCKGQEAGDDAHGSIYRVKSDGTMKRKIFNDRHARRFSIAGSWLYVFHNQHIDESNSVYKLFRMTTGGGSVQQIQ